MSSDRKQKDRERSRVWKEQGCNREKHRLHSLKKSAEIGGYTAPTITPERLLELRDKHPGTCDLCGKQKILVHDHCHETGRTRGFVCRYCNRVLAIIDQYLLNPELFDEYRGREL